MNGTLPRVTIGRPALRAALVSIEMSALTFFSKISESNAFARPPRRYRHRPLPG